MLAHASDDITKLDLAGVAQGSTKRVSKLLLKQTTAIAFITEQRYNLKTDVIEADQCIKSWLKNSIANGQAIFNSITTAIDNEIVDIT